MKSLRENLIFIAKYTLVGLVVAIILALAIPELLQQGREVVEIRNNHATSPVLESGQPVSYADAVKRAAPAVVFIFTSKVITERRNPLLEDRFLRRFFGEELDLPRQRIERGLGSGVLVSPQGYVLTNHHVIADADQIQVLLADGRSAIATLVGADPETDLAILRIKLDRLPSIILNDSDNLTVGDVVLAIGNPYGVGQTVTMGIVSATGRTELGITTFEDFIQTDAAINPGNSGGALINTNGELVGINTAFFAQAAGNQGLAQGIGFAIPMRLARHVMSEIIQTGFVARGWLGIEVQDVQPLLAAALNLTKPYGALVKNVHSKAPASKAGLQIGDIIRKVNGHQVSSARDALNQIVRLKPGTSIRMTLFRAGKTVEARTVTAQRPMISRL